MDATHLPVTGVDGALVLVVAILQFVLAQTDIRWFGVTIGPVWMAFCALRVEPRVFGPLPRLKLITELTNVNVAEVVVEALDHSIFFSEAPTVGVVLKRVRHVDAFASC